MMIDEIYYTAISLGASGSERLRAMSRVAECSLKRRLRDGTTAESCDEFVTAAAMIAAAMDMELDVDNVTSFKAGQLSITKNSGVSASRALYDQAEMLMAPYVSDGGFSFVGVQG